MAEATSIRSTVSIVVPAFNREAEIGRTLDTVLAQTYDDFELIVVDDCSTDGTLDVVRGYTDPRIRIVHNDVNRGCGGARNVGVEAARTPLVAFLDSDDLWLPSKLERQIAFMVERGLRVSCTGFYIRREGRDADEVRLPDPPVLGRFDFIDRADICIGDTMMIERSLFAEVGLFDETMIRLEDWEWELRLGTHVDLHFVPELLAVHHAPTTRRVYRQTREAAGVVLDRHRARLAAEGRKYERRLLSMAERYVAHSARMEGDWAGVLRHGMAAMCHEPVGSLRDIGARLRRDRNRALTS